MEFVLLLFFFSSRRRHTRGALVTGVQTCALPIYGGGPPGWLMAGYTVAAIAGLVLAGRFVLRPLLHLVGRLGERELFVVVGLFTVLAAAALMHALHLSTALGAFIAGRSEEHTSKLQSLMRISYAVF